MLSEEWLRVIKAERQREIEAARWAAMARAAAPRRGRLRSWFRGRFAAEQALAPGEQAPPAGLPQTGRTAADPWA